MTSDKQIQANKENGKLGGVKTDVGREITKFNALKHGILSKALLVKKEDVREFNNLKKQLFDELQPVGILETMQVDFILAAYWRSRAVILAEQGEIRKYQDNFLLHKATRRTLEAKRNAQVDVYPDDPLSANLQVKIDFLTELLKDLEEGEGIDRKILNSLLAMFAGDQKLIQSLKILCSFIFYEVSEDKSDINEIQEPDAREEANMENATKSLIRTLTEELGKMSELQKDYVERERVEDEAGFLAASLPNDAVLQKISRYEASLNRIISRAMNQLEHIQAIRLGRPVPTPGTVDINVEGDAQIGFVSQKTTHVHFDNGEK